MKIPFENHAAAIGAAVLSSILILPAHAHGTRRVVIHW